MEQVTEKEEFNEKGIETPNGGVGVWLLVGLSIGVLVCLGIALKRVLKWCKKGTLFKFNLLHFNVFYFQSERVWQHGPFKKIVCSSTIFVILFTLLFGINKC